MVNGFAIVNQMLNRRR